MKIYFDMDGVLADWDARARQFGIEPPFALFKTGEYDEQTRRKIIADAWRVIENKTDFWEGIAVMSGAEDMLSAASKIGDLYILSKTPNARHFIRGDEYPRYVKTAKINWIMEKFPQYFTQDKILIAAGGKADFVGNVSGDILVDDLDLNITDWRAHGGIGILHKSIAQTIAEFRV